MAFRMIRKGMWATCAGQVGVIAGIGPQQEQPPFRKAIGQGQVDFHVVNKEGETIAEALVDIRAVSPAAYLDIPEPRRAALSEEQARVLGYLGV